LVLISLKERQARCTTAGLNFNKHHHFRQLIKKGSSLEPVTCLHECSGMLGSVFFIEGDTAFIRFVNP